VNAVLRGYLREREVTEQLLGDLRREQPWLGYAHPEWLFKRWEQRWGREKTVQLMAWNNNPPGMFARVNTLRATAESLLERWNSEEVGYSPVSRDWLPAGLMFELQSHPPLPVLGSFQAGLFYVQDPSTLLAVRELAPKMNDRVLDLCAAPGGKTTYIAQLMENKGQVFAQDLQSDRLQLIQENCARLGVTCVEVGLSAASLPGVVGGVDRALLDAPCSNTGVMRRRVDLRWRIREQELRRLQATQFTLLRRAGEAVKPGGTLVYSTCSLEPEENRTVVDQFLSEQPDFKLETERQLLPFVDEVDGAYVARLVRVGRSP
jgi:16S rRNA (cytosine967-C5)-methyltransferase